METKKEYHHSITLFCFQYAKFEVIEFLASLGQDMTVKNWDWASALHYVAMNPDPSVFELFENYDIKCEPRSKEEQIKIAKYLLEESKTSIVYDFSFNTILSIDLLNSNIKLFNYVLNDHVEKINDHFLFHAIFRYNRADLFEFVLNLNTDVNGQNPKGITPLMLACFKGNIELVTKFIELMADVNAKDEKGRNCLHYAALPCNLDEDEFEPDCDIIHSASESSEYHEEQVKSPELIKILVKSGVDTSCKDNKGRNALHYAIIYGGSLDIIKELTIAVMTLFITLNMKIEIVETLKNISRH